MLILGILWQVPCRDCTVQGPQVWMPDRPRELADIDSQCPIYGGYVAACGAISCNHLLSGSRFSLSLPTNKHPGFTDDANATGRSGGNAYKQVTHYGAIQARKHSQRQEQRQRIVTTMDIAASCPSSQTAEHSMHPLNASPNNRRQVQCCGWPLRFDGGSSW